MHNAYETTIKKQKKYQSKNMSKKMNAFDAFWNILKQFNVSNVNFESTINDLKQILIVWNLFLTNRCWFETIKKMILIISLNDKFARNFFFKKICELIFRIRIKFDKIARIVRQTHYWQQHNLSNFKTNAIMNRFLFLLQRWIAFILFYNLN